MYPSEHPTLSLEKTKINRMGLIIPKRYLESVDCETPRQKPAFCGPGILFDLFQLHFGNVKTSGTFLGMITILGIPKPVTQDFPRFPPCFCLVSASPLLSGVSFFEFHKRKGARVGRFGRCKTAKRTAALWVFSEYQGFDL